MPIDLSIVASLVRETNGILKLIDPDIPCGKSQSKQEVGTSPRLRAIPKGRKEDQ